MSESNKSIVLLIILAALFFGIISILVYETNNREMQINLDVKNGVVFEKSDIKYYRFVTNDGVFYTNQHCIIKVK